MKRPLLLIVGVLLAGGAGVFVLREPGEPGEPGGRADAPSAPAPVAAARPPARGDVAGEARPAAAIVPRWARPTASAAAPAVTAQPLASGEPAVPLAVGPTSPARDRSIAPVRLGAAQITPQPSGDPARGEARLEAELGSLTKRERITFREAHERARNPAERVPGETALRANLVKAECTARDAAARYRSLAEPARAEMRRRCARFDVTFAP